MIEIYKYNHNFLNIVDDAPISIIVEGTTVEATDVDTVGESSGSKSKPDHKNYKVRQDDVPHRTGSEQPRSRPISEGPLLQQQGSWPCKVPNAIILF